MAHDRGQPGPSATSAPAPQPPSDDPFGGSRTETQPGSNVVVGGAGQPITSGGAPEPSRINFASEEDFQVAYGEWAALGGASKAAPWEDYVVSIVAEQIRNAAKIMGFNEEAYLTWFEANTTNMLNGITPSAGFFRENPQLLTVEHLTGLASMGIWWLQAQRPELAEGLRQPTFKSGGGGTGRPTAAQIRASFDVDELARGVQDLWRGYLLDENDDPRGVARDYIEEIVRNPEQKLDFKSYVVRRIEGTADYARFAKRKPPHMSYEAFLGPYAASAAAMLGPGDEGQVKGLVQGGTGLASSPSTFQQRLSKERQVTGSAPFINNLETRLQSMKGVFRS